MNKLMFSAIALSFFVMASGAMATTYKDITYCTNINQSNTYYRLLNDVYFVNVYDLNHACFYPSVTLGGNVCNILPSDVTIDLNGHTLYMNGTNASADWGYAFFPCNTTGWTIKNGYVNFDYHLGAASDSGFMLGVSGIYEPKNMTVENIHAYGQGKADNGMEVGSGATALVVKHSDFKNFNVCDIRLELPQSQITSCEDDYDKQCGSTLSKSSCTAATTSVPYAAIEPIPQIPKAEWEANGYGWALPFFTPLFLYTAAMVIVSGIAARFGGIIIGGVSALAFILVFTLFQIYPAWIGILMLIIGGYIVANFATKPMTGGGGG
jgi:hypothetical protein